MEQAGRLVGEALIFVFLFALVTGGFLAYHFIPGNHVVIYDGSYAPLQGTEMSAAYEWTLRISFEVDGGLLMRQLHHKALYVLALGTVLWAVLARHRYAFAALGLCLAAGLAGYITVDDLLGDFVTGSIWWYALHLLVSLAMAAVLLIAARREAAREPRTFALMAAAVALALLAIYWI